MPLDQTLSVAGAGLGLVGVLLVVVARLRADPTPVLIVRAARVVATVRAGAGAVNARLAARSSGGAASLADPATLISTATTGPIPVVVDPSPDLARPAPGPPLGSASTFNPAPQPGATAATALALKPALDPAADRGAEANAAPEADAAPDPSAAPSRRRQAVPARVRKRRRPRKDGRSNAELDDELVTTTALGWFALWMAVTLAIGYVSTEVSVLQILAQIAIAGSVVAIGLVVFDISRRRARHVGWMIDLFVATAAMASLPGWFHRPWFGQGRFDHLDDWLPTSGTIDIRLNSTIKDYGPGIIAHVLVQAAGIAAVLAVTLYIVATIIRRARGRYGHQPRDRWVSMSALAVTLVAAVGASGAAVSVPVRTFASSTFTTAAPGHTVDGDAPALALRADRLGRVALLFARCGDDRILALTVNGHVVLGPDSDDGTGFGAAVGGGVTSTRVPAGLGPVTVVFRSTRTYETTVVFRDRPRANRFIPLRSKDTLTAFYKRGHGC